MTDEEWRQKLRKQMEAHSGKKIEDVQLTPEEEAKRKAQWQETVKLLQKEQEERRRLKAEDPEAYRKLKEKEDQEMREYLDSVPFWD